MMDETELFLSCFYMPLKEDMEEVTHFIIEKIDTMFLENRFDECNELLQKIDLKKLEQKTIITILALTYVAKDKLPYRQKFCHECKNRLLELLPVEKVEQLLINRC